MSDIKVEEFPGMRIGAIAHHGAYHEIGPVFGKLGQTLAAANAFGSVEGMLGLYHDDPAVTAVGELRSHAGVIWKGGDLPEGLEEIELPAGRYAVKRHVGSYEGLPAAWAGFTLDTLTAAGLTPRYETGLEIYRNDPTNTPTAELVTDLCLPVE